MAWLGFAALAVFAVKQISAPFTAVSSASRDASAATLAEMSFGDLALSSSQSDGYVTPPGSGSAAREPRSARPTETSRGLISSLAQCHVLGDIGERLELKCQSRSALGSSSGRQDSSENECE